MIEDEIISLAAQTIGDARRIVDRFWNCKNAANPYDRETAWAMHVAMVQLAEVFRPK